MVKLSTPKTITTTIITTPMVYPYLVCLVTIGLHFMPPLQKGTVKTNTEEFFFTAQNGNIRNRLYGNQLYTNLKKMNCPRVVVISKVLEREAFTFSWINIFFIKTCIIALVASPSGEYRFLSQWTTCKSLSAPSVQFPIQIIIIIIITINIIIIIIVIIIINFIIIIIVIIIITIIIVMKYVPVPSWVLLRAPPTEYQGFRILEPCFHRPLWCCTWSCTWSPSSSW